MARKLEHVEVILVEGRLRLEGGEYALVARLDGVVAQIAGGILIPADLPHAMREDARVVTGGDRDLDDAQFLLDGNVNTHTRLTPKQCAGDSVGMLVAAAALVSVLEGGGMVTRRAKADVVVLLLLERLLDGVVGVLRRQRGHEGRGG